VDTIQNSTIEQQAFGLMDIPVSGRSEWDFAWIYITEILWKSGIGITTQSHELESEALSLLSNIDDRHTLSFESNS
jgi:hypothetical protein